MKKILIVMLSLAILFAFAACDDSNKPGKLGVEPLTDDTVGEDFKALYDGAVSSFQSNVDISPDGVVKGNFTYISVPKWNVDDEDEGYYLLVRFDVDEDTEVTVNEKSVVDDDWLLFLGIDEDTAKKASFTVTAGGKEITLTISDESTFTRVVQD